MRISFDCSGCGFGDLAKRGNSTPLISRFNLSRANELLVRFSLAPDGRQMVHLCNRPPWAPAPISRKPPASFTMATIVDGKKRIPFMRGMLVHHLIQLGFDDEESYEVADAVRAALRQKKDVPAKEMLALIDETLTELCGRTVEDLRFWEPTRRASVSVSRGKANSPFPRRSCPIRFRRQGCHPRTLLRLPARSKSY